MSALYRSSALRSTLCSSCLRRSTISWLRFSSNEATSPLLAKIKADVKTAMKAKDTARLNVLRSIIAETNRQASGPNPIDTDLQLLALLKKKKAASKTAAKEFAEAKREDLKEKEETQVSILDEYAASVKLMSEDELQAVIDEVIAGLGEDSSKQARVMKALLQPGGQLDGKPIDKAQLSRLVSETIKSRS